MTNPIHVLMIGGHLGRDVNMVPHGTRGVRTVIMLVTATTILHHDNYYDDSDCASPTSYNRYKICRCQVKHGNLRGRLAVFVIISSATAQLAKEGSWHRQRDPHTRSMHLLIDQAPRRCIPGRQTKAASFVNHMDSSRVVSFPRVARSASIEQLWEDKHETH